MKQAAKKKTYSCETIKIGGDTIMKEATNVLTKECLLLQLIRIQCAVSYKRTL